MVIQPGAKARDRRHGGLLVELVVAMALLILALLPLAYSFTKEQRYLRSNYLRAVAMEIVDGEMEILAAGEWHAFKDGTHAYQPRGQALTNLQTGTFELTIAGSHLRLEWRPAADHRGGVVMREVTVP